MRGNRQSGSSSSHKYTRDEVGGIFCELPEFFLVSFDIPFRVVSQVFCKSGSDVIRCLTLLVWNHITLVHQEKESVVETASFFLGLSDNLTHKFTDAGIFVFLPIHAENDHRLALHGNGIQGDLRMSVHAVFARLGAIHTRSVNQHNCKLVFAYATGIEMGQVYT